MSYVEMDYFTTGSHNDSPDAAWDIFYDDDGLADYYYELAEVAYEAFLDEMADSYLPSYSGSTRQGFRPQYDFDHDRARRGRRDQGARSEPRWKYFSGGRRKARKSIRLIAVPFVEASSVDKIVGDTVNNEFCVPPVALAEFAEPAWD